MDLSRRRDLMGQKSDVLNTSPKIAYENAHIISGGNIAEDQTCVVTALYPYSNPSDSTYTLCYYGTQGNMALYSADRRYIDYWSITAVDTPKTRAVLYKNSRTSFAAFTLRKNMLDDCFAYVTNTGQILFAGKNSIYYGHRNISEIT